MSGPAKTCPGGQVLTANQRKYFHFFRLYTFPFLLAFFMIVCRNIRFTKQIYQFLIKSSVLLKEFITFYKIIGFTKRIYHFSIIIGFTKKIHHFL